jgi:protein-disulfide isomerase
MGVNATPTFFVQKGSGAPVRVADYQQLTQELNKTLGGT